MEVVSERQKFGTAPIIRALGLNLAISRPFLLWRYSWRKICIKICIVKFVHELRPS